MDVTTQEATKQFSLVDCLDLEWIKLPLEAMREVGPAVQTLGGLLRITKRETFVSAARIAERARLPVKTVRNHIELLHNEGWILNTGRQRTRRGFLRRTATISIHKRTIECLQGENSKGLLYGVLPWWACCSIRNHGKLTWSAKAVLSILMAKLMQVKKVAQEQEMEVDQWFAGGYDGGERFQLSLSRLQKETGLSRDAIVDAKQQLHRRKIIGWSGRKGENGAHQTDMIYPSCELRVVQTPAGPGKCYLDFASFYDKVG